MFTPKIGDIFIHIKQPDEPERIYGPDQFDEVSMYSYANRCTYIYAGQCYQTPYSTFYALILIDLTYADEDFSYHKETFSSIDEPYRSRLTDAILKEIGSVQASASLVEELVSDVYQQQGLASHLFSIDEIPYMLKKVENVNEVMAYTKSFYADTGRPFLQDYFNDLKNIFSQFLMPRYDFKPIFMNDVLLRPLD